MTTPEYIKNLTIEERAEAIKLGASMAFARNGITQDEYATKMAFNLTDVPPMLGKGVVWTSLAAGVPLGIVAHALGRATSADSRESREAIDRLRYYQDLVASMENKLPPPVPDDAQEDLDKEAKSPAWQRSEGKNSKGGLNEKGRKSYERANPGSDLKAPVTGKVKPGGKASKRRKSYCSRSEGQMKMHNISCSKTPDKRICKARRKWKCAEDSQEALSKEARIAALGAMFESASTEKSAKNRGLSTVEFGTGPQQMQHALAMLGQARSLVDPEKTLAARGISQAAFDAQIDALTRKDTDKYNFSHYRKNPKTQALLGGLLGMLGGGAVGSLSDDKYIGGALGGLGGAAIAKLRADRHNRDLMATARVLKEYGLLQPELLRRAKPLLTSLNAPPRSPLSL